MDQSAQTGKTKGDLMIIEVPTGISLYEPAAQEFVEKLFSIAHHESDAGGAQAIVLVQDGPGDDLSKTWVRELRENVLLDDLATTLARWRWLLSLIRNADRPWFYVAAGHCFDSRMELALACRYRLITKARAAVGFPSIQCGTFPPGGALESLGKRSNRVRDQWQEKPILRASRALESGLVQFYSDCPEPVQDGVEIVRGLCGSEAVNDRASTEDHSKEAAPEDPAQMDAMIGDMVETWRGEGLTGFSEASFWDYGWRLFGDRAKLANPREYGRLVSRMAARHFLSERYDFWLNRPDSYQGDASPIEFSQASVAVDLDALAPPTACLTRMLEADLGIVFAATEGRALASALDLIYGRLERALGSAECQRYWDKQVSWFIGVADHFHGPMVRWTVNESVVVRSGASTQEMIRIEGNSSIAESGIGELIESAPALPLGELVCEQILSTTGIGKQKFSAGMFLRSVFFEELIRVSQFRDADLNAVLENLGQQGWGFASRYEDWDRFLRTRPNGYSLEAEWQELEFTGFEIPNWGLGSWKHARATAKRNGANENSRWGAVALSHHMAICLGLAALALCRQGVFHSEVDADRLAGAALSFPEDMGTPIAYMRRYGGRRIQYYARTYWPGMSEQSALWQYFADQPTLGSEH